MFRICLRFDTNRVFEHGNTKNTYTIRINILITNNELYIRIESVFSIVFPPFLLFLFYFFFFIFIKKNTYLIVHACIWFQVICIMFRLTFSNVCFFNFNMFDKCYSYYRYSSIFFTTVLIFSFRLSSSLTKLTVNNKL